MNNATIKKSKNSMSGILVNWAPMIVLQIYLSATVIIYAFGPWPWPTKNPVLLYLFLIIVQVALFIGYRLGQMSTPHSYIGPWKPSRLIKISLLLNLIWIIPNYINLSNSTNINISNIIDSIATGILNPGDGYRKRTESSAMMGGTTLIGYASQIISPLLWLMSPLCIYYWNRISRSTKFLYVFAVLTDLLTWASLGTNKGIFDFALMMPSIILAARPQWISNLKLDSLLKGLFVALIGGALLFLQFSNNVTSRARGYVSSFDTAAKISLEPKNWMLSPFTPDAKPAAGALLSYVSQGYYPLSLSLNEPFVFSYGIGNSYYYTGIVQRFTGPNSISRLTYPARIEGYGWSRLSKWHSIYPWIASDISFFGVPFFVLCIGWLLSVTWRESIHGKNPFAIALLPLLILMIFYFPANNQILAFSKTANSFVALTLVWLFTRRPDLNNGRKQRRGLASR